MTVKTFAEKTENQRSNHENKTQQHTGVSILESTAT